MDRQYDTWVYDVEVIDGHTMDSATDTFDSMALGTFDWPKTVDGLYDAPLPAGFKRWSFGKNYVRNNSINL